MVVFVGRCKCFSTNPDDPYPKVLILFNYLKSINIKLFSWLKIFSLGLKLFL
jgi:hypothetical protein